MNCKVEDCVREAERRQMCRPHYRRWLRYGDPLVGGKLRVYRRRNLSLKEKGIQLESLKREVQYPGIDEPCWEFTETIDKHTGYGIFGYTYSGVSCSHAHQVSMLVKRNGVGWGDLQVLHKCNNKICFNPQHLYLGSRMDNEIDKRYDGVNTCRGKPAVFSEEIVRKMRRIVRENAHVKGLKAKLVKTVMEITGVNRSHINRILRGEAYKEGGYRRCRSG